MLSTPPPLSLYIHLPWCLKKCPYCDFNSYQAPSSGLPEQAYIDALITDLEQDLPKIWGRKLTSIFIGGGTPSLFSATALEQLLSAVQARLAFSPLIEITLEANPGSFEQQKFKDFKTAGINRLSIGIQSFQDQQLLALGRVHNSNEAKKAVDIAYNAGFEQVNLDIMHGLPGQTIELALADLETALSFKPTHFSWYQLTLEPNTVFAKFPPRLPKEDTLHTIQDHGFSVLEANGFQRYEVSAFCQPDQPSQHNLNYWQFGDYLGIGAGAHSKLTDINSQTITRFAKTRSPKDYLDQSKPFIGSERLLSQSELPLEFMMNVLRLTNGVDENLFQQRTGLDLSLIESSLKTLRDKGLLREDRLQTTELGLRFLNDCLEAFM